MSKQTKNKVMYNVQFTIQPKTVLLFVFVALLRHSLISQIDVMNDGASIINTNVDVVINGNVIHQNNGSISNVGNFYITNDCINNNPAGNVFTTGNNGWVH